MIRPVLILALWASIAWPVTRTHQELIDLVGRKGDITHLYDLYTRSQWVTPVEYGAVPNDTLDDFRAFRLAVATGKAVFIPEGEFILGDTVVVPSHSLLFGTGRGSKVKAKASTGWGGLGLFTVRAGDSAVTFRDFAIDGNKANADTAANSIGIKLLGCSRITVSGMYLHDFPSETTAGGIGGGDGLYIGRSTYVPRNILITGSEFARSVRQGISVTAGIGVTIQGNWFSSTSGTDPGAAIDVEPDAAADTVRDLKILDNVIEASQWGILLYNAAASYWRDIDISRNTIRTSRQAGIYVYAVSLGGVDIHHNAVSFSTTEGIRLNSARNVRASFNEVHDNTLNGFSLEIGVMGAVLDGNRVYRNGRNGLLVDTNDRTDPPGNIIRGNQFLNNSTSSTGTYHGMRFLGSASKPNRYSVVEGNILGNLAEFGTASQQDGIRIDANARYMVLRGNSHVGGLGTSWVIGDTTAMYEAGAGVPAFTAASGSTWSRSDGGAGTSFYVREGGSWAGK